MEEEEKKRKIISVWQQKSKYLIWIIGILVLVLILIFFKQIANDIALIIVVLIVIAFVFFGLKKPSLDVYKIAEEIKKKESKRAGNQTLNTSSENVYGDKIGEHYYIYFKDINLLYIVDSDLNVIGKEEKTLDEKRREQETSDIAKTFLFKERGEKIAKEELKRLGFVEEKQNE